MSNIFSLIYAENLNVQLSDLSEDYGFGIAGFCMFVHVAISVAVISVFYIWKSILFFEKKNIKMILIDMVILLITCIVAIFLSSCIMKFFSIIYGALFFPIILLIILLSLSFLIKNYATSKR